jgi:hypothetical protein
MVVFRCDGASRNPALIQGFQRSKNSEWEWIARSVDGVPVTAADVIIMRKDFECNRPG